MLFIRANTHFNIHTLSIHLISTSVLCPSDITIHPSTYPHVPACTPAPVAFYPSFCQLMHKQPPGHYSGIPALVPGGAMCTAGMAMLGSAFLQPTGCMLHISKCSIFINFHTKSPAEQACTTFHLPGLFRRFMSSVWPLGFFIPPGFRHFLPIFIGFH